jgi:hypothetical protein
MEVQKILDNIDQGVRDGLAKAKAAQIDDGGSAFPLVIPPSEQWSEFDRGLSIRDWFAAHAPEPGIAEIAHFIGLDESFPKEPSDVPGNEPWHIKQTKCVRGVYAAMDWRDKLAAATTWKYAWADAMLAAREAGGS